MLPCEYARSALQIGLQLEQRLGRTPYKFGMIGATDSRTALATASEDNFFGKHAGACAMVTTDGEGRRCRVHRLVHGLLRPS